LFSLLGAFWVALSACSHYRFANDVGIPYAKKKIYVPVFVDETVEGTLGFDVANAIRVQILQRQPQRLAGHMGSGVLAIDGTIIALKDKPRFSGDEGKLVAGTYVLELEVDVVLSDHEGKRLRKLGRYEADEEYITEKEMERTEEGRRRALIRAATTIAGEIIADVNDLGRKAKKVKSK